MLFEKRKIFEGETVGNQLQRAREAKKMSIEVIAKRLLIQPSYLQALETGDRRRLPNGVYARNFLREYARFLGLDYRLLVKQFLEEESPKSEAKGGLFERQIVAKRQLIAVPVVVRNVLIGVVASICLIYLGFLVNKIFDPPHLTIETPVENSTVTDRAVSVKGVTEPETDVTINGQSVQVAQDGSFQKELYLETGLNTITIRAKKKYGRPATALRYILFEDTAPSFNSVN